MSDFIGVPTTIGQAKIAAAIGGTALNLTTIRVGDGNGAPITPAPGMTDLVRRVGAAYPIIASGRDPVNATHWRVTALIPVEDGPFDIREIGVFDGAGDMIAIARHVLVEKRSLAQGAAVELLTDIVFPVSETAQVTVQVTPTGGVSIYQMLRAGFTVVESATVTAPPGAPGLGRTHVVPAGSTGAWAGLAGYLTQWNGTFWVAADVPVGFVVVDNSKAVSAPERWLRRTAGGWIPAVAGKTALGVIRLATEAEVITATDDETAVTPATMRVGARAHGQCQLRHVGSTEIRLYPKDGDLVRVAGKSVALPVAGVAAANTAVTVNGVAGQNLAANTEYLVALGSAGALEFWTKATGHNRDTTAGNIGVEVITGHADKTLVGLIATNASSQFANSAAFRGVISWFNRRSIDLIGATTPFASTFSIGYVELHGPSRIYFLTWADEAVDMEVAGQGFNDTTGYSVSLGVGVDGVFQGISGGSYAGTGGQSSFTSGFCANTLTEGLHYVTPMGTVGAGGTGTFSGAAVAIIRG